MSKRQPTSLRFQTNTKKPMQKQQPVGKKQRLTIERLSHDGRGIAHVDGQTWFVTGALPNEEVEARIVATRSKLVDAKCERIFTAAPNRQTPPCQYAGVCGGCELQHLAYEEQLTLKQSSVISQLHQIAGITIKHWDAPLVSDPFGYRRRTRLAVRYNDQTKQLDVGFRAAFSQKIINISDCLVLVEPLRELLKALPDCLNQLTHKQHIGHVELFSGSNIALLVRHTKALEEADLALLKAFCQKQQCQLWLQGKDQIEPYWVETSLNYTLALADRTLTLNYRPGDFVQVNGKLNQAMVLQALEWLKPSEDDRVLDLFSGLGNFSLALAPKVAEIVAVEAVENMVKLGTENAQSNGLDSVFFYQTNLSLPLVGKPWLRSGFSKVLLDPPRDGAAEVVKELKKLDTKQILYVSCNAATLARDMRLLIDQGYRVKRAGIMDMFPQTSHTEVMVLLEV